MCFVCPDATSATTMQQSDEINCREEESSLTWNTFRGLNQKDGGHEMENMCVCVCVYVCLCGTAFLVGGSAALSQFVSFIGLSFCLSFWPDKHHYSVCRSRQWPHQCKHPHTRRQAAPFNSTNAERCFSADPTCQVPAEWHKLCSRFL